MCNSILKGQNVPGTDGTYHGTDGTCPRDRRDAHQGQTPPSYGFGRYGFGFFGPRIAFRATGALWGRATPFFYHFSVHLSSILGRTELCPEVWAPGPQKPQIISNENHHLALLDRGCPAEILYVYWFFSFPTQAARKGSPSLATLSALYRAQNQENQEIPFSESKNAFVEPRLGTHLNRLFWAGSSDIFYFSPLSKGWGEEKVRGEGDSL